MGKKCSLPRCISGYKSCTEKICFFAAPKDSDRLKMWPLLFHGKIASCKQQILFVKNILMRDLSPNHGKRYLKGNVLVRKHSFVSFSRTIQYSS